MRISHFNPHHRTAPPATFVLLLAVLISGCHHSSSQNPEDAIRAALQQHVSQQSNLNLAAMDMNIENISVNGDHAQAHVQFRLHENNVTMEMLYDLEQHAGSWIVTHSQPAGGPYPPINNQGFIGSYFGLAHVDGVTPNPTDPERIMKYYDRGQVPVLTALARSIAVCDRCFSSIPGPTWPNRFFIHAASSGGLDDSPSGFQSATFALLNGYRFENGTIYDQLVRLWQLREE